MIYFNEWEPYPAQWLRNLYPEAVVDERSIADVRPEEVAGYERAHFFGGIGGWQYALELAGWPADAPVWTGSCPCQPFSIAGKGQGVTDERHLWPQFYRLIRQCRPPVVFGEQVASALGRQWLAGVRADVEALGYEFGAADLCAASTGAPHIRQRLYWVAHTTRPTRTRAERWDNARIDTGGGGATGGVAHTRGSRQERAGSGDDGARGKALELTADSATHGLAHDDHDGSHRAQGAEAEQDSDGQDGRLHRGGAGGLGGTARTPSARLGQFGLLVADGQEPGRPAYSDAWEDCTVILCADGKYRRIPAEPALFPLAHGLPGRANQLRASGNSIIPQVAATFVRAVMDVV